MMQLIIQKKGRTFTLLRTDCIDFWWQHQSLCQIWVDIQQIEVGEEFLANYNDLWSFEFVNARYIKKTLWLI